MRLWLLVLTLGVAACGPRDRPPPPADTTVADTVVVDTFAPSPADTAAEFGDDGTVPLADTLLPPLRTRGAMAAPSASAGLRVGLSGYKPTKLWGSGFLGATTLAGNPEVVCPVLRTAEAVGMSVGFSLPRPLMNSTGGRVGRFVMSRAKATIDAIARACPNSELARFTANRTLNYITLMDDPGSLSKWGGQAVTAAEVYELARYAQEKIGAAPIGVRIAPEWMASYSGWNGVVDMAKVQWHTRKRQPQAEWYQRQRDLMPRLGIAKLSYSVNIGDCDGPGSGPCSAEEVLRYGAVAIDQPGSCGMFNWRYEESLFRQPAYRAAWETLVARGKAKDPRTCAR